MGDFIHSVITSPLWGVFTLFLGWLVGHRLAIGRDKRNSYEEAARKFRAAFEEELYFFCPPKNGLMLANIIDDSRFRHEVARNEFRVYLKGPKLREFDKVWSEYQDTINKSKEKPPVHEFVEEVSSRLQNLMECAKP